jgi:F0F1-type ATP synthase assembly protein I
VIFCARMEKKDNFKIFYALSFAWQLGFLIVIPIGGFILLGSFVDDIFKTKPIFLITGSSTGIIITAYEIYHLLIPLIKDKEK